MQVMWLCHEVSDLHSLINCTMKCAMTCTQQGSLVTVPAPTACLQVQVTSTGTHAHLPNKDYPKNSDNSSNICLCNHAFKQTLYAIIYVNNLATWT